MYTLRNYGAMVGDSVRTPAFAKALERVVSPESIVLDIGTGTGIFALLACRLGARRVYAIEPDSVIEVAREIARDNGFADRIVFMQGVSTGIELPERANVVVSDLHGVLPFFQRSIETLIDARTRLATADAVLIPRRDLIHAAVVTAPREHFRTFAPWSYMGIDMKAAHDRAANTFDRTVMDASQRVSTTGSLGVVDYRTVRNVRFHSAVEMPILRQATAHGIGVWFESELAEGVVFSNDPAASPNVYGHAFFPWPEAVEVERGDVVHLEIRADPVSSDYLWSWESRVTSPRRKQLRFQQSEFFGESLSPEHLRRRSASHVPVPTEEARIDASILALMHEGLNSGEIARRIQSDFPGRFARWQEALGRVGELAVRYGA